MVHLDRDLDSCLSEGHLLNVNLQLTNFEQEKSTVQLKKIS